MQNFIKNMFSAISKTNRQAVNEPYPTLDDNNRPGSKRYFFAVLLLGILLSGSSFEIVTPNIQIRIKTERSSMSEVRKVLFGR